MAGRLLYCHQEILTEQPSRWKRKQRMIHLTSGAGCPWQGKRLPSFAVGHRTCMMQSLEMASSPELRGAVLLASPHESARILDMDTLAKRSPAHALRDKSLYLEGLPFKISGAFASYCGGTLMQAKECVSACIREFKPLQPAAVDDVTRRFLHPNHVVGQQLRAFARHRTRSLHAFPDAFVAVQELSS